MGIFVFFFVFFFGSNVGASASEMFEWDDRGIDTIVFSLSLSLIELSGYDAYGQGRLSEEVV